MESLAYLQAALAHPSSIDFDLHLQSSLLKFSQSWQRVSSQFACWLLTLATTCALVSVAQAAVAQDYNPGFSLPPVPVPRTQIPVGVSNFNSFSSAVGSRPILRRGDENSQVRELQNLLRRYGCFSAGSTGFFGSVTEAAVIACQQRFGVEADGIVGSQTWSVLLQGTATPQVPNYTGNNTGAFNVRELRRGDRGENVSRIQQRLKEFSVQENDFLLDPGEVDGIFGADTERAVIRFQEYYRLPVTGIVTRQTLEALNLLVPDTPITPLFQSQRDLPYIVAIPQTDGETLSLVRSLRGGEGEILRVPRRGNFIYAGAFENRSSAEAVVQFLRTSRLDARVVYLPYRNR